MLEAPEETAGEGQESQALDTSSEVFQVEQEATSPIGSGDNPAWAPFLSEVPDAYHETIKKHLRGYDEGVQKRFTTQAEQYDPYKSFVEQKVDPRELQAAYTLAQQLNGNPIDVYERLGQALMAQGYTPQQAQQAVQEAAADNDEDSQFEPYEDPRIAQLEQQQQAIINGLQQQYQAQEDERVFQETTNQIDAFRAANPLPDWEMREVLNRARNRQDLDVEKAYVDWVNVKSQMAQNSPGRNAPGVLSASGGIPSQPQTQYADLSARDQKADVIAALRAASGS